VFLRVGDAAPHRTNQYHDLQVPAGRSACRPIRPLTSGGATINNYYRQIRNLGRRLPDKADNSSFMPAPQPPRSALRYTSDNPTSTKPLAPRIIGRLTFQPHRPGSSEQPGRAAQQGAARTSAVTGPAPRFRLPVRGRSPRLRLAIAAAIVAATFNGGPAISAQPQIRLRCRPEKVNAILSRRQGPGFFRGGRLPASPFGRPTTTTTPTSRIQDSGGPRSPSCAAPASRRFKGGGRWRRPARPRAAAAHSSRTSCRLQPTPTNDPADASQNTDLSGQKPLPFCAQWSPSARPVSTTTLAGGRRRSADLQPERHLHLGACGFTPYNTRAPATAHCVQGDYHGLRRQHRNGKKDAVVLCGFWGKNLNDAHLLTLRQPTSPRSAIYYFNVNEPGPSGRTPAVSSRRGLIRCLAFNKTWVGPRLVARSAPRRGPQVGRPPFRAVPNQGGRES